MSISLLVASSDEQLREMIRENLLNQPNAKVISEYPVVASNLYIRVLQDLERHPESALIIDLSSDPDDGLKTLEKVRQAAPDLYIIAAGYNADGENVLSAVRSGAWANVNEGTKSRIERRSARMGEAGQETRRQCEMRNQFSRLAPPLESPCIPAGAR